MSKITSNIYKCVIIFSAALTSLLTFSCARVPLSRTLPSDIQSVFVPMFENKSQEPGIEEIATNFTVEEILADGRLKVTTKSEADASIELVIKTYNDKPETFNSDEFNKVDKLTVIGEMKVWRIGENKPMGEFTVSAEYPYLADTRFSTVELPIDARENLMRELASNVFQKLMSGKYTEKQ